MRATVMYGAGDVRMESLPDPVLQERTDAVVRVVRACVCGTDLHLYHSMPASAAGSPMGHEFLGVVEEIGTEVSWLKDAQPVRLHDGARLPTADALRILGNWTTDQESAATPSAASQADY
jgi:threonine dehydrogenase-like Zn-dependent dehydrogenase